MEDRILSKIKKWQKSILVLISGNRLEYSGIRSLISMLAFLYYVIYLRLGLSRCMYVLS